MGLSKKLRFEVFKRDGFSCAYCGNTPPGVVLEVDHVDPKSGGGDDDINNLITACFDCNRGKNNIPLDKIPSTLAENLQTIRDKEEQIREYRKFTDSIKRRLQKDIKKISNIYELQYPEWHFGDNFKNSSLRTFLQRLPFHEVEDALYASISKFPANENRVIRYFCGICWHKIKRGKP